MERKSTRKMRDEGLEPPRVTPPGSKPGASANSANPALQKSLPASYSPFVELFPEMVIRYSILSIRAILGIVPLNQG